MKPKTKRILIIAAIVLAVAFVLWMVFRKGTKKLIDQLGLSADLKLLMEQKVAEVEAYAASHPNGSNDWSKEGIKAKAAERGVSYTQMVLIEAAYSLYDTQVITYSQYDEIEQRIKSL